MFGSRKKTSPVPASAAPKAVTKTAFAAEKFSLVRVFTLLVFGAVILVAASTGIYSMWMLRESKMADMQTVIFLQLDFEARRISSLVSSRMDLRRKDAARGRESAMPLLEVPFTEAQRDHQRVFARLPKTFPDLSQMDKDDVNALPQFTVLRGSGTMFVIERARRVTQLEGGRTGEQDFLIFWQANLPLMSESMMRRRNADVTLYILSREGQLLQSTDPTIQEENIARRELVARFIKGSFKSSQVLLTGTGGEDLYGFYSEIPRTNLVLFSETPRSRAMAGVTEYQRNFLIFFTLMIVLVLLLVQLPLQNIVQPIRELGQLAIDISQSGSGMVLRSQGLGELATLTRVFGRMSADIAAREKSIRSLAEEQRVKERFASELEIAKRIQENFLPRVALSPDAGISVAARYEPADEVAGDWYGQVHLPETGDTVITIVDVAGHGAGASMFTAMAAVIFEELSSDPRGLDDITVFAEKLNRWILHFGKQKWHATMQIVKFKRAAREMEILNAGHCFPIVLNREGENPWKATLLKMPSSPLGLSAETKLARKTIPFGVGTGLLTFTDGLIEGRNMERRVYGNKAVVKICERTTSQSINELVATIHRDWQLHVGKAPGRDDFCLIGVQAES